MAVETGDDPKSTLEIPSSDTKMVEHIVSTHSGFHLTSPQLSATDESSDSSLTDEEETERRLAEDIMDLYELASENEQDSSIEDPGSGTTGDDYNDGADDDEDYDGSDDGDDDNNKDNDQDGDNNNNNGDEDDNNNDDAAVDDDDEQTAAALLNDIFYSPSKQGLSNPVLRNATHARPDDWEDFFRLAAARGNREILDGSKAADPSSPLNLKRVVNLVFKGQARLAKLRGVRLSVVRAEFARAREKNGVRQRQRGIRAQTLLDRKLAAEVAKELKKKQVKAKKRKLQRKQQQQQQEGKINKKDKKQKKNKVEAFTPEDLEQDLNGDLSGLDTLPPKSQQRPTARRPDGEQELEEAAGNQKDVLDWGFGTPSKLPQKIHAHESTLDFAIDAEMEEAAMILMKLAADAARTC